MVFGLLQLKPWLRKIKHFQVCPLSRLKDSEKNYKMNFFNLCNLQDVATFGHMGHNLGL